MVKSGQCIQRKWELIAMMAQVKHLRPSIVLEIGTYRGGSLRCWSSICPSSTTFVSIDLPWEATREVDPAADIERMRRFLKSGQSFHWLRRDSHADATKDELLRILGARKVDFLFIDGDHSHDGVRRDYELYNQLVRTGGLIAFHDIVPNKKHPDINVHLFWAEVKRQRRVNELVDANSLEESWGGIGVVHV
jgi:predicted O-methyltransferase YrrM